MCSKAALRKLAILSIGGSAWIALAEGGTVADAVAGDDENKANSNIRGSFVDQKASILPQVADAQGGAWDWGGAGTGQIGDDCYRHNFCASEVCSSSLAFSGSCVECLSDEDCEGQGQSLPGVLPKAFCHEAEGEYPVCSRWRNGRPIGERGYPVWLGHNDIPPIWLGRQVFEGPPTSLVWRFDLNNQVGGTDTADKFEANATHVRIPLNEPLVAGYSMSNPMVQEHETGIASIYFGANPQSVVTPYPQSLMGEKYHTLTYDGPMDESHKIRVTEELEARDSATAEMAVSSRLTRVRLQAAASKTAELLGMLVESLQDVVQLDQLRAYVQQLKSGDAPLKEIMHTGMRTEATEAIELAKTLPSLKSMNQCTHFEERDDIRVTESHLEFPLNSPSVFLKGITEFIPAHYYGINAGLAVAHYDAEAHILEFHLEMTQSGRMYPYISNSPKNGLWLGSNDDATTPNDTDGRSDQFYKNELDYSFTLNTLFRSHMAIPIDYSAFDSPTGTCDQETADDMSDLWTRVAVGENVNIFNKIPALRIATEGIICGSNYLKGDAHEGLVGIDFIEFGVWSHLLLEQDDASREAVCTGMWFDDWDAFYKAQA